MIGKRTKKIILLIKVLETFLLQIIMWIIIKIEMKIMTGNSFIKMIIEITNRLTRDPIHSMVIQEINI